MDERKFALIIAASAYTDPGLPVLQAPARDAQELAAVLGDPELGGFEVPHPLLEPTSDRMRKEVEDFLLNRKRDDFLLLYFAGHGVPHNDGELFLATVDTELLPNGDPKKSTAVAASFVNDLLASSNCGRKILLLDCCYSGRFAQSMIKGARGSRQLNLGDHFDARGLIVLASSNARQQSFEGTEGGVFTQAIVEGLKSGEADRDMDGWFSYSEVYDYVCDRIQGHPSGQKPSQVVHLEGKLVIAKNPRVKAAPLPRELKTALKSPFPKVRVGAIEELWSLARDGPAGLKVAAREELRKFADPEIEDSRLVSSRAQQYLAELGGAGPPQQASVTPTRAAPADDRTRPGEERGSKQERVGAEPGAEEAEAASRHQERAEQKQPVRARAEAGPTAAAGTKPKSIQAEREREKAEFERLVQSKIDRGQALHKQGELKEAIAEYRQAIKLKDDSAETHYCLAKALYDDGDRVEAIREGVEAITLNPSSAEACVLLSHAFRDRGDAHKDIKDYQKAIKYLRRSGSLFEPNYLRELELAIAKTREEKKAERERAERERVEAARAERERAERERAAKENAAAAQRSAAEKLEQDKAFYATLGRPSQVGTSQHSDALPAAALLADWSMEIGYDKLIKNPQVRYWLAQQSLRLGLEERDFLARFERLQKAEIKVLPPDLENLASGKGYDLLRRPAARVRLDPWDLGPATHHEPQDLPVSRQVFFEPSGKVLVAALGSLLKRNQALERVDQGAESCSLFVSPEPSPLSLAPPLEWSVGLEPIMIVTVQRRVIASSSVEVRPRWIPLITGSVEHQARVRNLFEDIRSALKS